MWDGRNGIFICGCAVDFVSDRNSDMCCDNKPLIMFLAQIQRPSAHVMEILKLLKCDRPGDRSAIGQRGGVCDGEK